MRGPHSAEGPGLAGRRPPLVGGLPDGSSVCLGVRRPTNSSDTSKLRADCFDPQQGVTSRTQNREPCNSGGRPVLDSPQNPDSPAAVLDSWRGRLFRQSPLHRLNLLHVGCKKLAPALASMDDERMLHPLRVLAPDLK